MTCTCTNTMPCQPCLDSYYAVQMHAEAFNKAAQALNEAPVYDDRNWTPEDEDEREWDRQILHRMIEDSRQDENLRRAVETLYSEELIAEHMSKFD